MYIPQHFKMESKAECHDFIREYGFGILLTHSLTGSHLPFVLKSQQGDLGTLYGHCARANTQWKELENTEVLVIFSGPHSYISPSWYSQAPAVPTWNYTAVHAYGKVTLLDKTDTLNTINDVVLKYEPELLNGEIITDDYKDKLMHGLVAFKIELTRIQGKQKLGQQKSHADQQGVYQALSTSSNLDDIALARYIKKWSNNFS